MVRNEEDDARRFDPVEGSWVYVSGGMQVADPAAAAHTYDRFADACIESGWHTFRPYAENLQEPMHRPKGLVPRLKHALHHADACVLYIGKPSSGVGAEVAWATDQGRPVVAVYAGNEEPSPMLKCILEGYERARVIHGVDPDDCVEQLRETLRDPSWSALVRKAAGELADDLH